MKFSRKLKPDEYQEYIQICFKIWGGAPVDVDWAMETKIYQAEKQKENE